MIGKLTAVYRKMSKRERLALYGTAAVLMIVFIDRAVIGSVTSGLSRIDRQIQERETLAKRSLHVLVQKQKIQDEAKELAVYDTDMKNDPEAQMTALLKEVESLAAKVPVTLLYVKPASSADEGQKSKYLASLECEADMEQMALFFHSIESSPKLLKIEKFDIQPKSRESSIARCVMTVSKTVLA